MRDIDVDGYRVEAGTVAIVGIYAMHRDPALWDNPLVFDPDRFSPENSKGRDRWQLLPSVAGRVAASVITSPCSKPLWRWPRSFGVPRSGLATPTFPSRCRPPWSPAARFGPVYTPAVPRNDLLRLRIRTSTQPRATLRFEMCRWFSWLAVGRAFRSRTRAFMTPPCHACIRPMMHRTNRPGVSNRRANTGGAAAIALGVRTPVGSP